MRVSDAISRCHTVGIYNSGGVGHTEVTIALRLARAGRFSPLLIADLASGRAPSEQGYLLGKLAGHPVIRVVDPRRPERVDALLIPLPDGRRLDADIVRPWLDGAGRVFGVSGLDSAAGTRAYARQLVRSFPHYLRCAGWLTLGRIPIWHPFRWAGKVERLAPSVHTGLWFDCESLDRLFAPRPETARDLLIVYAGNKTPAARESILRAVRGRLTVHHGVALHDRLPSPPAGNRTGVWVEYAGNDHSASLSHEEFATALGRSRFCLCPTGWSAWTHRLTEAVVLGAVLVAAATECRALGLRDMEHVIAVKDGNWSAAIDRAIALTDDCVSAMRANLAELTAARFAPDAAARHMAEFLFPSDRA